MTPSSLVLVDGTAPTEEQICAIESEEASLVVSASAGSGKTRVLVERYLRHVTAGGLRPDQILAITFTRKAAAEMKRRIVDRLTELGRDSDARIAETGPIQTIHGFCERLLRENAIEAGIDPDFEILAPGDQQRLLEQAIEVVLAYIPEGGDEAAALVRKLAGRRAYGESLSPHARLEMAIREAISKWRGTGVDVGLLEENHRNAFQLLRLWQDKMLADAPEPVRAQFEEDRSNDRFGLKLERAYKTLKKQKPRYIRASVDADLETAQDTCGLMQLVTAAWVLYESKMRTSQQMDFTALEATAVELLKRSTSTRERVREQYRVVLVDECQDLNPVQHDLLKAMNPATEMFVGDEQQSIYGFRQADPTLFARRLEESSSSRLSKNHRSDIGILSFVDFIFSQRWGERYKPMLERPQSNFEGVELWVQRQRDTPLTAEWVRDYLEEWRAEGRTANEVAILVRKSFYAMDLFRSLEALGVPCRVSGGTEQFYARLEVRDLANALEALTDPNDDFALWAMVRSPFVGLSLDALVLLSSSKDGGEPKGLIENVRRAEFILPSALSEDIWRVKDFLGWFEPLAGYADRLAAWELISELFAKTPYLENLAKRKEAPQRLANVRKLLSLATQSPEVGPREFAEQIREIQAIRHKEGDAPAGDQNADEVTIMTIHKSKGLEFPVVILPDTHQYMTRRPQDVEVDPRLQLITAKFGHSSSMFHEWLALERQKREEEEEWRVAYVAMTRAKERLCVMVNPSGSDHFGGHLYRLLKKPDWPPLGVRLREAPNVRR